MKVRAGIALMVLAIVLSYVVGYLAYHYSHGAYEFQPELYGRERDRPWWVDVTELWLIMGALASFFGGIVLIVMGLDEDEKVKDD